MRSASIVLVIIVCAGFCCTAGCIFGTAPVGQDQGTMAPSQAVTPLPPSPAPAGTTVALLPGPTRTPPPDYYVAVDVQKQGQSGIPVISVIFRGGTGMAFTTQVAVTVTRSDGQVITKSMNHPAVGDEIDIGGTAYDDRVEITDLVSTGDSYKIYDQILPYQSVN